jgi:hypothetical protein
MSHQCPAYSLALKCPPKVHVVNTCSLAQGFWEVMEPLRGEALWEISRLLGCAIEGDFWDPGFFLSLSMLPGNAVRPFTSPHCLS